MSDSERVLVREVPPASERLDEIRELLRGRRPVVVLDCDGTLAPIVDDPAQVRLTPATRDAITRLAARTPVAIMSGRDLDDLRGIVDLDGIWYGGSHGFELVGPEGQHMERAPSYLPALASAEAEAREALAHVDGARVERKRFAIAIHDRGAPQELLPRIREAVKTVASHHPRMRLTGGKHIHELRPDLDWDKGQALLWLLDELDLATDTALPIYLGDDETDEDAFRVLADRGLGFVVRGERDDQPTWADYALADPADSRRLIERFADWTSSAG